MFHKCGKQLPKSAQVHVATNEALVSCECKICLYALSIQAGVNLSSVYAAKPKPLNRRLFPQLLY